jgi:hypothetical protein
MVSGTMTFCPFYDLKSLEVPKENVTKGLSVFHTKRIQIEA